MRWARTPSRQRSRATATTARRPAGRRATSPSMGRRQPRALLAVRIPKTYATSMTCTATINGENGNVKGQGNNKGKPLDITGTVAWSANMACGTTSVTPGNPGTATCSSSSASSLPVGTDTITATYSGDSNHSGSAGSTNEVVQGGIATTIDVTAVSPVSEAFGSTAPVTITAVLAWTGHGVAPTAADVIHWRQRIRWRLRNNELRGSRARNDHLHEHLHSEWHGCAGQLHVHGSLLGRHQLQRVEQSGDRTTSASSGRPRPRALFPLRRTRRSTRRR